MSHHESLVFLTVRGTAAAPSIDAARELHNATAGSPEGIAAARALGDLSHKVYAPVAGMGAKAGELLFHDWWKSAEGIGRFFSDAQVQAMAAKLFSERDATLWMPARGAFGFDLPAPSQKNERLVGMVRGAVATPAHAVDVFRSVVGDTLSEARARGQLSHQLFVKLPMPDDTGPAEVLGVDLWCDPEGMGAHYASLTGFEKAFQAAPVTSVWRAAPGQWSEW